MRFVFKNINFLISPALAVCLGAGIGSNAAVAQVLFPDGVVVTNAFGDTAEVLSDALASFAGFKATDGLINSTSVVTAQGIFLNDGPTNLTTFTAETATGNVTSTGTGTFNGNLSTGGIFTAAGTATFGGAVTAPSFTSTNVFGDTVSVTNDLGNSFAGVTASFGGTSAKATMSGLGFSGTDFLGNQAFDISTTGDATFAGTVTAATVNAATVNAATVNATSVNAATVTAATVNAATVNATSVNAATVTATTANIQTANVRTANVQSINVGNSLTLGAGSSVDMGGNIVQNVATPISAADAANKGYVDSKINNLTGSLNQALKNIDNNTQGIAIAMAMSGMSLSPGKRVAIGGNVGFYNGKQAAAFQAAFRVHENVILNGAVGFGFDSSSYVGGRVGAQIEF
jgi:hypothetical protein